MAFVVPSVYTAIDKVTPVTKKMTASVDTMAAKSTVAFNKVDRSIRSAGRSLRNFAGGFGLFLGASLAIGVFGDVINVFKDFEQANANLSAVTGATGDTLKLLSDDAKRLGATTAFTASQVTGLQTEFGKLGFSTKEILDSTEATLALAAATGTELPQAASQVGAAIRAFNLDATESARVADVFAKSTSASALSMEFLNNAVSTVAPVAATFGFKIEETTALLGSLADAGFDASSAATATRNILLNLADSNGKLAKAIGGPVKNLPELVTGLRKLKDNGIDLAGALDLTDKRSVAAFSRFINGADSIETLNVKLSDAGGTAEKMAKTQLDTLNGSLTILRSAYEGFILSLESGDGAFSNTLRNIVDVAAEMFSLASGSATAFSELDKGEKVIRLVAQTALFLTKTFIALGTVYIAVKAATIAYNTVLAIQGAITGSVAISVNSSRIAMAAYKIALVAVQGVTKLWTAAQWALNVALNANPIGLIIIAIAALVGIVVLVINKWDEWGAALSIVLGPLGLIISLIQSFRRNWDSVIDAFTTGGIVAGLTRIGQVILDAILAPIQQALELANRFTGFGGEAAEAIRSFRETRLETIPPEQTTTTAAARDEVSVERSESISREQQEINVNVRTDGNSTADVQTSGIPVSVDPTFAGI